MLQRLRDYGTAHGHYNVPAKYGRDPELGCWVNHAKHQYNKPGHGTLAIGERLQKLRDAGVGGWSQKSYILSSSLIIESEGARTATP